MKSGGLLGFPAWRGGPAGDRDHALVISLGGCWLAARGWRSSTGTGAASLQIQEANVLSACIRFELGKVIFAAIKLNFFIYFFFLNVSLDSVGIHD